MQRILDMERKDNRIRAWFWVASILLLASYLVTLINNKSLLKEQEKVEHTYKVILNLEILYSAVKDAETGARGYTNTGDEQYLQTYYAGLNQAHFVQDSLYVLLKDNYQGQVRNMDSTVVWVKNRFDLLKKALVSFNENNKTSTDYMVQLRPEALHAQKMVDSSISIMKNVEQGLLKTRTKKARNTNQVLDIFTFTSIALALGILSFSFITYRREHSGRKKAYKEVSEYQDQLKTQVTDLDVANKELVQMRTQEKFAASGRIARQIAHEVRNPLTNINLATNQLKEDLPELSDDALYLFDMITRNSERINHLISELLNSTKFQDLNFSHVLVTEVLEDALELAADRISLSKVQLVKHYGDIKPIMADEGKLKIAFLNLVVNAIEAMDAQPDGMLTLEAAMDGERVKVVVKDNGKGMNQESLSKLFEPYFTTKQKGNGLGLTNTQNIILNHKGEINVSSKINSGTTFTIYLG